MFSQVARNVQCILGSSNSAVRASRSLRTLRTRSVARRTFSQPRQPDQSTSDNVGQRPAATSNSDAPATRPDVSSVLANINPSDNQLLAPVHIPEDKNAVLKSDHPATNILAQSGLVVTRQIEMMNIFLGFEQANRYVIMDPQGNHIGYMAEHDGGIAKAMGRQWFKTHRAFTTHVFDRHAQEVLRFHRPFSWINSRIKVYDPLEVGKYVPRSQETAVSTDVKDTTIDGIHSVSSLPMDAMRVIGETHSEWAPLRRKYNLFLAHELDTGSIEGQGSVARAIGHEPVPSDLSDRQKQQLGANNNASFAQFAYVDEPWLSWDFSLKGADDKLLGSVNRNWRGFGRELFTDTGMYVLRMDSAALEDEAQRLHVVSQTHRSERAYGSAVGAEEGALGMTLDQRALMLATAVTVDFDYFSRHSSSGGGMFLPVWLGGGGGEAAGGAAAGTAGAEAGAGAVGAGASEAGVAVGAAGGRAAGVAGAASELGAGEGAIAGAGTMAGYEAMQRGLGRDSSANSPTTGDMPPASSTQAGNDPDSPQYRGDGYGDPRNYDSSAPPQQGEAGNDTWGSGEQDPWQESGPADGGGGDGEGGGLLSSIWESFFGD